ncbi:MAG: hypoxanthine phosphoribosyltransferase [Ignavibacteria bacterium]|nr:hypoxanthine phosphoribosyltransferase [Ignavibacteria bacterium]
MKNINYVPFITNSEVKKRIKDIAKEINKEYKNKVPVFIGVLNGAFVFMADLIREIKIDCEIDFYKLSSYGDRKISSGEVKSLKDLNCDITGRDVIVVEDIIDSGLSIKYIKEDIQKQNPKSLKIASLLFKEGVSNLYFDIDYIGFKIPNEFVVGYGLDYAQKYRNLKGIFVLKKV